MGSTANSIELLVTYQYESNIRLTGGDTNLGFLIRLDPNDLLLDINDTLNAAPDSELILQTGLYCYSTPRDRSRSIVARYINISRLVGTAPLRTRIRRRIPILTLGCWEALRLAYPPVINYQGQTDWVLVSTRDESSSFLETPFSET